MTAIDLQEIDYGLWQGLTIAEIRRRQPKAYRQWLEAPSTIRPPGGEALCEAQERIRGACKEIMKRHKSDTPLLVLRPIALSLVRCLLENKSTEMLWGETGEASTWCTYEVDEESFHESVRKRERANGQDRSTS